MSRAAAEGKALDERWHLKKDGERFWAEGLVMPLKDDAGETRGFLKIVRDMTEQRRLEEAFRRRTTDLEEAVVCKDEFLAMLAHELRAPLAAIRNAVTLAARSGAREDLEWSRDVTARHVKNFAHLIDDLLDVSRNTQGKIQLREEIVDAGVVLGHAVEAVRTLVEERKHELLLSFTTADLRIEADTTRLEQMLVNLLANAAKYTPSGGRFHCLPAVPAASTPNPTSTEVPAREPVRGRRVLVVDDDEDTANGMAKLLRLSGHSVQVAHDGPAAITSAIGQGPQVVLLDIGLPGMDGYEVAARLKQEACCKGAMMIAVSVYGEEQAKIRSEAAGFDLHLVKPVDLETLLAVLAVHDLHLDRESSSVDRW
jgi:CheY-like chemotaxis protein